MKLFKIFTIAIFFLATFTSFSEIKREIPTEIYQKFSNKIKNFSKDDFIRINRNLHLRTPDLNKKVNFRNVNSNSNAQSLKSPKSQNKIQVSDEILQQAVFPGEFDEVKAVMITWSYFTLDSTGQFTDQLFDGLGSYYDQSTNEYFLGPVYSTIDTFETSPYPLIFSKLAWAINQETQVWINVWYPSDTTTVLDYMKKIGLPLTNYKFFVHPGNSFWYRDCGPMAFYYGNNDDLAFLDMEYYGGRPLDDSIPQLIAKDEKIPLVKTTLEYEGGNILLDGLGNLYTSSAVYIPNSDAYGQYYLDSAGDVYEIQKKPLLQSQVRDSLMRILNLKSLKVLNSLRYDGGTGHIDLYADMWDETNFVFSKMPDELSFLTDYSITRKNIDTILSIVKSGNYRNRCDYIPFPKRDDRTWYTGNNDYQSYTRTYSNHTFVNKSIIQPVFSDGKTGDITGMYKELDSIQANYPGYTIIPIDVRAFDGFGGAIHCITKQIPADNPLRIYHYPIDKWVKPQSSYNISATIQNKSGIASAKLFYREKGSNEWNETQLVNSDNAFNASIPNALNEGAYEYYLQATSNNGKTMTKPITAPAGFYTFNISDNVSVGDNNPLLSGDFYPNPATNETNILITNTSNIKSVQIYNSIGILVYSENLGRLDSGDIIKLSTANFPNGIYFVDFIYENGSGITKSFVVNK